ncbi:PTS system fructose/mannose transporter EIIBCA component [Candidatus Hepatincolaceae symbiont of Richtersius coronifer]
MLLDKISKQSIYFTKIKSTKKEDVFIELCTVLKDNKAISDLKGFYDNIMSRENVSTTFIENMVAIPHAKSDYATQLSIVIGVADHLVSAQDSNNNSATLFFMLCVPKVSEDSHIEILGTLAQYIINENFCRQMNKVSSYNEAIALLSTFNPKDITVNSIIENSAELNKSFRENTISQGKLDIVAITACPVGIAHTYMAAKSLEKAAAEMGLKIKVQTNGSIGIKNTLTSQEIKEAKAVIIASDIDIDLEIFGGKKITRVPVAKAVKKPKELIQDTLKNEHIYAGTEKSNKNTGSKETSSNRGLGAYKHLLNGVSFMIPFVVIGGIFIALAIAFSGIEPNSGVAITNPFLKHMENIGALSFGFMIPILAGYIGYSIGGKSALAPAIIGGALANSMQAGFLGGILIGFISGYFSRFISQIRFHHYIEGIAPVIIIPLTSVAFTAAVMFGLGEYIADLMRILTVWLKEMQGTSSIFLNGLLGAMIAVDMGGPINKVAFLFGVSMIPAGIPTIMGSIAVAVSVPPIGMWLATVLRPKKYSSEERIAGKAAVFMGLIGITEGAIPFAATDPIRVIPSIIVGSCVGAITAGFFKVADYAPHGGPIVLPVITNKLPFLIAIIIGSIITALMVNLLKKNKV